MQSITLTAEQTACYEGKDGMAAALRTTLRERAQKLANSTGGTVEVYADAGYVLDAYAPDGQPVTTEQIEALRNEAGEHGDLEQVAICDRAIDGDEDAIAECARVIAAAQAQQD